MMEAGLFGALNEKPVSPSMKGCDLPQFAGLAIKKSAPFMLSPVCLVGNRLGLPVGWRVHLPRSQNSELCIQKEYRV
jgi:hypothetical protein